ncbi:alcohol dehydrogenase catalytic domain-containing protein [Sphingomonas sp. MG17]|uniref:Alcohol dehydrogenase catalytic domain-containing protein n=1 Tax=Sphingomonas tagetis TaxID=2949092 RepID=A0A9X2KN86_9SPHN|nr:alcohol dehydrogenase catalytic domain-containing protein [Sphingomonas tagetis]MCP3732595.1 alcohol dehydrogenase catalytic domain-containing protein [Sphingomonas tagetis]
MAETMRAARLHEIGQPMKLDVVRKPIASGTDVVVQVQGCGMVPNLANVLANWQTWYPQMPLPPLPAIFGLDPVGMVHQVGDNVVGYQPGDYVYVNPGRACQACHSCLSGTPQKCGYWTLGGYFGYNENSLEMFRLYPEGGFCEFMRAPQTALVKLPDGLAVGHGTRFGYLGTSYAALKKCGPLAGKSIIINGATGTLGVGATILALAMGAARIYAVARGEKLLSRLEQLAPGRVITHSNLHGPVAAWVKSQTSGKGADYMLDTLGAVASLDSMKDAMYGVKRGGRIVNIGGTAGDLGVDVKWWMDEQMEMIGSVWFTTADGIEMADMIASGAIDISVLEPKSWPLDSINEAINGVSSGDGGFTNYLVTI